jgi:hypothetical protein
MNCRAALRYLAVAIVICIGLDASSLCLGAQFPCASAVHRTTHTQAATTAQLPQQIPCIQPDSCASKLPAALTAKNGTCLKCEAAYFKIPSTKSSQLGGTSRLSANCNCRSTLLIEHVRLQI